MKPLLGTDHILYRKRLVEELNTVGSISGFYADAPTDGLRLRCNRARIRSGTLECRSGMFAYGWFIPSNHNFIDVYGRQIVASRKP